VKWLDISYISIRGRMSLPLSKTRSTISPCTLPPFDFNSVNLAPYSSTLSIDPMTTCVLVPAVDDDPFMIGISVVYTMDD